MSEFSAKVKEIHAAILAQDEHAVAAELALLEDLRREVILSLAKSGDDILSAAALQPVKREIERSIMVFTARLAMLTRDSLTASLALGSQLIDAPLQVLGLTPQFMLSPLTVQTAALFSADLITHLTSDARIKINAIIRRASLGTVGVNQAIQEVGASLDSKGVFRSIAARVEAIVRTETLRVQAEAAQLRMVQNAERMRGAGYELRKSWLTAGDKRVRETHVDAGIEYGKANAIPVDQPFIIGGEQAMYPRDPMLSAEESIQCRCVAVPHANRIAV